MISEHDDSEYLLRTFNSNDQMNGILVFHLVDIESKARPFTIIRSDVRINLHAQLLNDFNRGVVRYHQRCRLPPMANHEKKFEATIICWHT